MSLHRRAHSSATVPAMNIPRSRTPLAHSRQASAINGFNEKEMQVTVSLLDENEHLHELVGRQKGRSNTAFIVIVWCFSIMLACICTYAFTRTTNPHGTFAAGYGTDLREFGHSGTYFQGDNMLRN